MRISALLFAVTSSLGCLGPTQSMPPGGPRDGNIPDGAGGDPSADLSLPDPSPSDLSLFVADLSYSVADMAVGPGSDLATGAMADLAPSAECPFNKSLDRFEYWIKENCDASTNPANCTSLVKEGDRYVAHADYVGAGWHVAPTVWVANKFAGQVDLSTSTGFTVVYSATADLYAEVRPASHWDSGAQWLVKLPATGGMKQTVTFPFTQAQWTSLPELGTPTYSLGDALKEVRGLLFLGNTANTVAFYDLKIAGYLPPCI